MPTMYAAITNTTEWVSGKKENTSAGSRLEMWKASYMIIKENPLIGIGRGNYKQHKQILIDQGKIDRSISGYKHPHNEYFTNFVEMGIVGLLAFILVMLTPIMYFLNIFKYSPFDKEERLLAVAGLLTTMHYLFYSLSSGVFDLQHTALFYSVFMVIIVGLIGPALIISNSHLKGGFYRFGRDSSYY